jgi:hypothetical protein
MGEGEGRWTRADGRGQRSEVFEFGNRPPAHRGLSLRPGGNGEGGKWKGKDDMEV